MRNIVYRNGDEPSVEYGPETEDVRAALKVLVVDDSESIRALLEALLREDGHDVLLARNGEEAVSAYRTSSPDLILMDVIMPVLDGYQAARMIKQTAGTDLVPIIFLTSLTDENVLVECLEIGGDDFLSKPLNHPVLRAKLAVAARTRRLYLDLEKRQRALAAHHDRLRNEHDLAEYIFTRVTAKTNFRSENIKYRQSPLSISNGDLVLMECDPDGGQRILLGDSTGHGLSAAIGAIPISEIFYAMTRKGFGIREMVVEMNRKLHDTLPTGQFIAACIVDWNRRTGSVSVWNGGIPDALIVSCRTGDITRIPSRNLPLGVVSAEEMTVDIEVRNIDNGDRIYMYSDGVIEARDNSGVEFGQDGLESVVGDNALDNQCFNAICAAIENHRGKGSQEDDITLVEITCDEGVSKDAAGDTNVSPLRIDRAINLRLGPCEFKTFDSLTVVNMLVTGVTALDAHRAFLYTIIQELYANALEHGILGLQTAMKADPQGFSRYYEEREELLSALENGWIRIDIACAGDDVSGEIVIQVEDSGAGFLDGIPADSPKGGEIGGRGLEVVRSLCKTLSHDERGNYVRAVYGW